MDQNKTFEPVAESWRSYESQVVPANAGPAQRLECRRAFYAGVQCLLATVINAAMESPEDEGIQQLAGLEHELQTFLSSVKNGTEKLEASTDAETVKMYKAVGDFVASYGGSVLVAGGVSISQDATENYRFNVVIKCTGRPPKRQETGL